MSTQLGTTGSPSELFHRDPANPILTANDWPYQINTVFNPGATTHNGETVLLCRVEDRRGLSHLTVARSPGKQGPPGCQVICDEATPPYAWDFGPGARMGFSYGF